MNPDNMIILGIEISKDDADLFKQWLADPRSKFIKRWLQLQSLINHDRASKPVGPNAIADILSSQRSLAAENAFDQVLNFEESFNKVLKEEKLIDELKK